MAPEPHISEVDPILPIGPNSSLEPLPDGIRKRFNKKFIVHPRTRCWEWIGCRNKDGYGITYETYKNVSASRVSYKIHNGPIPNGMCVLHHCDNPGCVNPEHLFIGTQQDNVKDMDQKGRRVICIGTKRGNSKLNELKVVAIMKDPSPYPIISKKYNISVSVICAIKQRKTWKHVTRYI